MEDEIAKHNIGSLGGQDSFSEADEDVSQGAPLGSTTDVTLKVRTGSEEAEKEPSEESSVAPVILNKMRKAHVESSTQPP